MNDEELREAVRNPRTRTEAILDGVFSRGIVLVESEGDREVYQAASESIDDYPAREVHFVPVGGTGGFVAPLRFYSALRIPAAVIVDLDALVDSEKVADIAEALTGASSDMHDLIEKQRDLAEGIRNQPPTFTESDARERLEQLSRQKLDWRNGDDNLLRRQLAELSGIVKRVRRLKEGGVSAYKDDPEIYSLLNEVVDGFAQVGLFFVPVGQLEDWVVQLMADVPKRGTSKTDRAAIAADCIRAATDNSGDVWAFTRRVLDYLRAARK